MLQYLLNATAIWLMSLVLFDVFLRRESYHNYNRFYLLFTFMLGTLLPLWQWQDNGRVYSLTFEKPLQQVVAAKQDIVSAAVPAAAFDLQLWLVVIYLAGVMVAISVLIIDIIRLFAFYRNGEKTVQDGWTVVETGKEHAPFSFRHILFVSSRKQYSAGEWAMILLHENRHTALWHFADLLLMQVSRVIFWFHPLVCAYNKRLLLVHEYQADNASAQQPQAYGAFLVEQALLQSAPSVTHSFNRSPIKKRILMLTRKSSFFAKSKMLVFLPLALVCISCFSKNSSSHKFVRNGNFVTYKGNRFELSKQVTDTQIVTDPITGQEFTKYITHGLNPIKMNGKPIPLEVDKYPYFTGTKNLRYYLLKNLENELSELEDGAYRLAVSNVFIGEKGAVIYFDDPDIHRYFTNAEIAERKLLDTLPANQKTVTGAGGRQIAIVRGNRTDTVDNEGINMATRRAIFNKTCMLLENAAVYMPAQLNGKNVVASITYADENIFWNEFKVKDHKLYDKNSANEWVSL